MSKKEDTFSSYNKADAKLAGEMKLGEKLPLYMTEPLGYWCVVNKKHVTGTLETSVKDVVDNWGCVQYGVGKAVYEDDPAGVKRLMKKYGYKEVLDSKGKPFVSNGSYLFQHYTGGNLDFLKS